MTPAPRGLCSIYTGDARRPAFCASFPSATDWRPVPCAYTFAADGTRGGECDSSACGVQNCCNFPHAGGEPDGAFTRDGPPCQYLTWDAAAGPGGEVDRRLAQTTAYAFWAESFFARRVLLPSGEDAWEVGEVRGPPFAPAWTLQMPSDVFWRLVAKRLLRATTPAGTVSIHLRDADVAALRRLHPAPLALEV